VQLFITALDFHHVLPITFPVNYPVNQSTNQSTSQPVNQSTNQSTVGQLEFLAQVYFAIYPLLEIARSRSGQQGAHLNTGSARARRPHHPRNDAHSFYS
jgi:hypothetical protein